MASGFAAQPNLPVTFRGYDRAATDRLVARAWERQSELERERDGLKAKVDELAEQLAHHERRAQAVADALVAAQLAAGEVRAAAAAEIEEDRRRVERERREIADERASLRAKARQDAAEIVREARVRADRLVDELRITFEEYQQDTGQFLSEKRERLDSLVRDLLDRIPGSAREDDSADVPATTEADAGTDTATGNAAAA
jgi:cell division septum initiation protein DivIVA